MSRGKKLDKQQKDSWEAFVAAARDLVNNTDDQKAVITRIDQRQQFAKKLDSTAFLNAFDLPKDAGNHAQNLQTILERIPEGWGRWISCDRGWYSIILQFDAKMKMLAPNYEIHQIKEKYGRLDIYFDLAEEVMMPNDLAPDYPRDGSEAEKKQWEIAHNVWYQRYQTYLQTPAGVRQSELLNQRSNLAYKLADAASQIASKTCELCGNEGSFHLTQTPSPWYKTLCTSCAKEQNYLSEIEWNSWWEDEEPRFKQRQKENWQNENKDRKIAVIALNSKKELTVRATYFTKKTQLKQVLNQEWDAIFVGNDQIGKAYFQLLVTNYQDHIQANKLAANQAKKDKKGFVAKRLANSPRIYLLDNKKPTVPELDNLGLSCWFSQEYHFSD